MEGLRQREGFPAQENAANAQNDNNIGQNAGAQFFPGIPGQNGGQANYVNPTWMFPQPEVQQNSAAGRTYNSANEYAEAVRQWLWQYHTWNQMTWMMYMSFPYYAMNCGQPMSAFPGVPPVSPAPPSGATQPHAATGRQQQNEFRVPVLWKRVVAEFIDFIILFFVKIAVTIMTIEYIGIIDLEKFDIENLMSENLDYNTAFAVTSELVAMEIINRICICIFETLCLRRGVAGIVGGTTPGKRIMGLKVVSCEDCISLGGNRIRVTPAGDIGFGNALVRSVIKNFSLAFFFPVCFTVFMFQHSRAAYDVIASCIVVESNEEDQVRQRRR